MSNNIGVLYLTCNSFSELWCPFFELYKKYIDIGNTIYLCTDIPITKNNIVDFITSNTKIQPLIYGQLSDISENGNLYDRLLYYLDHINETTIFFFIDDMYPSSRLDKKYFEEIYNVLKQTKDVQIIKITTLSQRGKYANECILNDISFLKNDNHKDDYIFNVQPCLIKKDFFIEYLTYCRNNYKKLKIKHLNGGLEIIAKHFFHAYPHNVVLRVKNTLFTIYGGSHGICVSGYISDKIIQELQQKENLHLNLYNNCIMEITQNELERFGTHNIIELNKRISFK